MRARSVMGIAMAASSALALAVSGMGASAQEVAAATPPPAAPAPSGRWRVQLGAYGSAEAARGQWAALSRKIGALSGLQPTYEQAGKFTRLRVGPLADRAAADRLCASAKAAGQGCFTVAP